MLTVLQIFRIPAKRFDLLLPRLFFVMVNLVVVIWESVIIAKGLPIVLIMIRGLFTRVRYLMIPLLMIPVGRSVGEVRGRAVQVRNVFKGWIDFVIGWTVSVRRVILIRLIPERRLFGRARRWYILPIGSLPVRWILLRFRRKLPERTVLLVQRWMPNGSLIRRKVFQTRRDASSPFPV